MSLPPRYRNNIDKNDEEFYLTPMMKKYDDFLISDGVYDNLEELPNFYSI